jgi:tRNA G18 (ribose-2'-O)-methylase SpoU
MATNNRNIYIALENIRSLYNIGAIIRTAEFFGISKIILIGYSGIDGNEPDMIHRKLRKTSLGSIPKVKLEVIGGVMQLKRYDFPIIAVENNIPNVKSLYDWTPPNKAILLFGNEVDGISKEGLAMAQEIIEIPRIGTHSSLNVATACGIVINEMVKNLNKQHEI